MTSSILGTGINQETEQEEKVIIGDIERRGGLYVLGRARTGKSTLLINMLLQDIENGHGLCFLDPHGDAIQEVLRRLPAHRTEDVIYFDPLDETHAFGLNLFQCDNPGDKKQISRTLEYVLQVFAKLFTQSGDLNQEAPLMYETLLNTTILLIYNQGYTLAEVPLFFTNEDAVAKLILQIAPTHDDVRQWWMRYNALKPIDKDQITGSTRRRLQAFLTDEHIRHIVGQKTSTLNFQQITDTRKILLVKLSREFEEVTTLVGSMIIGHLLTTAYARDTREDTEEQRPHFCIYADEFQHFATPDFAKLFTETGKFHYAPTVAHQERVGQFEQHDKNRGATLAAANMVVYRTTIHDASEIAPEFAKKPPLAELRREEKLQPLRDVVSHLVHVGHSDPYVDRFVKELLLPIYKGHEYRAMDKDGYLTIRLNRTPTKKLLDMLNTLFYEVMAEKNPRKVIPIRLFYYLAMIESDSFPDVFKTISKNIVAIDPPMFSQLPYERWFTNDFTPLFDSFWTDPEFNNQTYEYLTTSRSDSFDKIVHIIHLYYVYERMSPDFTELSEEEIEEEAKKIDIELLKEQMGKFGLFMALLLHTMNTLAKEPITTGSGIYENVPGIQRTFADMVNEMALELPNLPRYTAYCKIVKEVAGKQSILKYQLYPDPLSSVNDQQFLFALSQRKEIEDRTHTLYCAERAVAEEEISARREYLLKPLKKERKTKQEEE